MKKKVYISETDHLKKDEVICCDTVNNTYKYTISHDMTAEEGLGLEWIRIYRPYKLVNKKKKLG
jgi:hypothetical protein